MALTMQLDVYSDFQAVVCSLPEKGNVYWYHNASGTLFQSVFVSNSVSYVIFCTVAGTTPESFASDFPHAIAITPPGNAFQVPQMGSTSWNIFAG